MTHFIQLHLLTTYAAANLNRDDTGRPKTLKFGGAERLRVSSQSLKRAFRTSDIFFQYVPTAIGIRSKFFGKVLRDELIRLGASQEEAEKMVVDSIGKSSNTDKGKNKLATWDGGKNLTHSQIVSLSPEELALLKKIAESLLAGTEISRKDAVILTEKPRAVDIAMFGRMLADNPEFNVNAAVQVAHAFTTHRATVEDDFFTAVSDLLDPDDEHNAGAAHVDNQYYGAGTFYLYICIDANLLLANLAGDKALAKNTLEALIKAAAKVSPKGKQNSFASRSMASYILQETGEDTPRSLAAAFQKPVGGDGENDLAAASVGRMVELRDGFARAYGLKPDHLIMDVTDPESATLQDLVHAAQAMIDRI
ncbi:type I-E CRISPR-associated protein Cas7/Cse4/CasC [Asticcacaulis sp. EMRT-3]|uniref:type I-E CRISPR-associated protein Cas7/Cse4/CasC n=1 Tax=Asticcacaulis sp. EMRT-3 TaxID=3040349 RepID=UPI0024AF6360|nr:type I-E CRISPR-associated protein Cas7/Cse4/CasC [Asticcacaulis sp. EMRT-3]MDI7775766.1 type I-E CRISPR-associated protein Cas7/Cse4/CasC [Asticcacaulis sp. EMRT-3]